MMNSLKEGSAWHVDLLLGGNHEIGDCTVAVARQRPANSNRGMVFSTWSTKQQLNGNRGTVFSVWSISRCYKQDSWSNELALRQLPASKNMSMEAGEIIGIRYQEMTGEDMAD
jgi:hypothetical protein